MKYILFIILLNLAGTNAIEEGRVFRVYVENDTQFLGGPGTDKGYSNGIKFTYLMGEGEVPFWSTPYGKLFKYFDLKNFANRYLSRRLG